MRITGLATAVALVTFTASAVLRAQTPPSPSIEGAWTLNKDLSDKPPSGRDGGQGREGHQGGDERGGRIERGEELLGDDRRERAVEIEVVPLEDRSEARGEDDFLLLARHRSGDVCAYRHR